MAAWPAPIPAPDAAYTYVGQEIHSAFGYATGWSMLMDYVLNPVICVVCGGSRAAQNILPLPYVLWAAFFALLFTFMNLRRIRATARINEILTAIMGILIVAMLVCTVLLTLSGLQHPETGFYTNPIYDPRTFSWARVKAGTSLAVLTYIGFDGISTLSEEVKNPRRNILIGTVLVCLIIGILSRDPKFTRRI